MHSSLLPPFQWKKLNLQSIPEYTWHQSWVLYLEFFFILTLNITEMKTTIQSNQTTAEKPDADHRWKSIESNEDRIVNHHCEYWERLFKSIGSWCINAIRLTRLKTLSMPSVTVIWYPRVFVFVSSYPTHHSLVSIKHSENMDIRIYTLHQLVDKKNTTEITF